MEVLVVAPIDLPAGEVGSSLEDTSGAFQRDGDMR